jgi:hypothetical protein
MFVQGTADVVNRLADRQIPARLPCRRQPLPTKQLLAGIHRFG